MAEKQSVKCRTNLECKSSQNKPFTLV